MAISIVPVINCSLSEQNLFQRGFPAETIATLLYLAHSFIYKELHYQQISKTIMKVAYLS